MTFKYIMFLSIIAILSGLIGLPLIFAPSDLVLSPELLFGYLGTYGAIGFAICYSGHKKLEILNADNGLLLGLVFLIIVVINMVNGWLGLTQSIIGPLFVPNYEWNSRNVGLAFLAIMSLIALILNWITVAQLMKYAGQKK